VARSRERVAPDHAVTIIRGVGGAIAATRRALDQRDAARAALARTEKAKENSVSLPVV
jgi:hypothetical protein